MGLRKKKDQQRPRIDEKELGQNVFSPMEYHGSSEPEFVQIASDADRDEVIKIIQERINRDGQWCIDNDLVGPKPAGTAKMSGMVAFATDPENINQCIDHPSNDGATVDFVCRDLANASKWRANVPKEDEQ